jgi:hypothetical protein
MATSGTVNQTSYPVNKIIEQALRRCGVPTSTINAEMLQVGRDNLFLLLTSWANRGINLWEVRSATIAIVAGQDTYDLPSGTVDLLNLLFRDVNNIDLQMSQLNRDDYTSIPDKTLTTSRPTLYWYDRRIAPQVRLWPIPDVTAATGTLVAWYHRQIEDVGQLTNTLDVPTRWLNAVVTNLAVQMMQELPSVDAARLSVLQASAAQALSDAESEETDGAPMFLSPDISVYTR